MSDEIHEQFASIEQHLRMVEIDLQCSLAFSRALLKGVAAASIQARQAVDAALGEAQSIIAIDDGGGAAAAYRIIGEARAELQLCQGETPSPP